MIDYSATIGKEKQAFKEFEQKVSLRKSEISQELESLAVNLKSLSLQNIPKLRANLSTESSLIEKAKSLDESSFARLFAWITIRNYVEAFHSLRNSIDSLNHTETRLNNASNNNNNNTSTQNNTEITATLHLNALHEMAKEVKTIREMCHYISSFPDHIFTNLKQFSETERVNSQSRFEKCLSLIVFGLASAIGWPLNMSKKDGSGEKKLFHRRQPSGDRKETPLDLLKKLVRILHENDLSSYLVIDSLVASIALRLNYHFEGKRETNRIDKPEWYLSYMQKCLVSVVPFVHEHFDDLIVNDESMMIPFSTYLISKLMSLVREKMKRLLFYIRDQSSVPMWSQWYSHCINEMIQFDRLIQNKFGLKGSDFECSRIVCSGDLFDTWFKAEKSCNNSKFISYNLIPIIHFL